MLSLSGTLAVEQALRSDKLTASKWKEIRHALEEYAARPSRFGCP